MVQFNLLPDVKIEYIKARRTKRLMTLVSIAVIGVSLFVFVLMIATVNFVQKRTLTKLNSEITTKSAQLKSTPDLNKILTVQNQLGTLTGLHEDKPVSSRLYTYLAQLTPPQISISNIKLDFGEGLLTITAKAPTAADMNAYTATMKATSFVTKESEKTGKAFNDVVVSSLSVDTSGTTFTVTTTFAPEIFSGADEVFLKVSQQANADPVTLSTGGQ